MCTLSATSVVHLNFSGVAIAKPGPRSARIGRKRGFIRIMTRPDKAVYLSEVYISVVPACLLDLKNLFT